MVRLLSKEGAARKLKFTRNTSYNGTDYGPDYEQDTADVAPPWDTVFLQQNRAVLVDGGEQPDTDDDDDKDNPLKGINFASDQAAELAVASALAAADFDGVAPSGTNGYTKSDVAAIVERKAQA